MLLGHAGLDLGLEGIAHEFIPRVHTLLAWYPDRPIFIWCCKLFSLGDTGKKLLRCEADNREIKIGLIINERNRTVTLEGKDISYENIKTFSDSLIYAKWSHSKGYTEINLDRLTGVLEVTETSKTHQKRIQEIRLCTYNTKILGVSQSERGSKNNEGNRTNAKYTRENGPREQGSSL